LPFRKKSMKFKSRGVSPAEGKVSMVEAGMVGKWLAREVTGNESPWQEYGHSSKQCGRSVQRPMTFEPTREV
jgi:hypothetical protein